MNVKRRTFLLFFPFLGVSLSIPGPADSVVEKNAKADRVAALLAAARAQTLRNVRYDGSYRVIPYPCGDVPADIGVCTDVIIRAYRTALEIDLQRLVHEDMARNFSLYPRQWGLRRPDRNIDHRRVPNLQVFFSRYGRTLPVSADAADYRPGDLVTQRLPGNLPHIAFVSDRRGGKGTPLIIHNIGQGVREEDRLFDYPITGHYRYFPVRERGQR